LTEDDYIGSGMPMDEVERYFATTGSAKARQDSLNGLYEYLLHEFNLRFELSDDDAAVVPEFLWEMILRVTVWIGDGVPE
jgi:hypothetical protein